jgi:hypothetical protein
LNAQKNGKRVDSVEDLGTDNDYKSNNGGEMDDYFKTLNMPSAKSGHSRITSKTNENQVGIRDIGHTEDLL